MNSPRKDIEILFEDLRLDLRNEHIAVARKLVQHPNYTAEDDDRLRGMANLRYFMSTPLSDQGQDRSIVIDAKLEDR